MPWKRRTLSFKLKAYTTLTERVFDDRIQMRLVHMPKMNLQSVVWKEGDYYVSQCLDVDVSSFGKTKKEALAMLEAALTLYFEDAPLPKKAARVKRPAIASVKFQHA